SEMQKISVFWLKRSDSWDWCGINKFIILLCVVNTVKQYKVKLTTLIFYALALSLILSLTFSAPTLNHFYPYSEEGGSAYHKIHPGSILLILSFIVFGFLYGWGRFAYDLTKKINPILVVSIIT